MDPIQGFDVSVSVMGPNGPVLAGEFQEIDIKVKNETEEYLELGERIARLLDGEIKIDGKLSRGWMNLDIITQVFGVKALRRGTRIPPSPRLTITATVNAPEKGFSGRIRLEQVKIEELSLAMKQGKGVIKKDLSYKAEGICEA